MAILRHFCCCFHVRGGSVFTGLYSLVTSAIFICVLVVRYVGFKILDTSTVNYSLPVYITLCMFTLKLLSAVLLIVGVSLDNKFLIIPWIIMCIVCIFEGAGVMCWILVRDMRLLGDIPPWEAGLTTFHLCNSIILVYSLLCVISQVQDLAAGKGTAEDYRRRRQRRRRRHRRIQGLASAYIHNTYIPDIDFDSDPFPSPEPPGRGPIITPPPYTADKPPPYQTMEARSAIPTVSQRCETSNNIIHSNTLDDNLNQPSTSGSSTAVGINTDVCDHYSVRQSSALQTGMCGDRHVNGDEYCTAMNFNSESDDNSVCDRDRQQHTYSIDPVIHRIDDTSTPGDNNGQLPSNSHRNSLNSHIRYFEKLNRPSNHQKDHTRVSPKRFVTRVPRGSELTLNEETKL